MNLYLIGYRGVGKSCVGRLLAERLGKVCVDADDEIEKWAGKSIADIFADEGEPAFRQIEAVVVAELAAKSDLIVALGGGAVLNEESRRKIAASGKSIWLRASVATIAARIEADASTAARRPGLTTRGPMEEIESLLAQRQPIYEACADLICDTDDLSPPEVADRIEQQLE